MFRLWGGAFILICGGLALPASATAFDYFDLEPEQLLSATVISASKKAERVFDVPAAVYVITSEDIARSGVMTIPDALRMAPGVQVAQSSSNSWVVSIRGFNNGLSNKLLVMIDGRAVYNPFFSGTYWEAQDVPMEDIERIEVVRGPGGALWGANAVNGVINIITKKAKDTQGNLLSVAHGNIERAHVDMRHGGTFGEEGYYRIYGKRFDRGSFPNPLSRDFSDDWNSNRAGFRADWNDHFTLQGDAYQTVTHIRHTTPIFTAPFSAVSEDGVVYYGSNLLAHWNKKLGGGAALSVKSYLDYAERQHHELFEDRRFTFDAEVQYDFAPLGRHELILGGGYRITKDDEETISSAMINPSSRVDDIFNIFMQDKITLVPAEWFLTLGSKFEYNDYSGFEAQPNARLQWHLDEQQTVWAAISRAVRTPSRIEHDVTYRGTVTSLGGFGLSSGVLAENDDFDSEELLAYELGYNNQLTTDLSMDLTAFYNVYDNLGILSAESFMLVNNGIDPPHFQFNIPIVNAMKGETYGFEAATSWRVNDDWKLGMNYSFIEIELHAEPVGLLDLGAELPEDRTPQHQVGVFSSWNIAKDWFLGTNAYYVGPVLQDDIDEYLRLDMNLGWRITDAVSFNLVGQNLLDNRHPEASSAPTANQVPTSFFGKLRWRF